MWKFTCSFCHIRDHKERCFFFLRENASNLSDVRGGRASGRKFRWGLRDSFRTDLAPLLAMVKDWKRLFECEPFGAWKRFNRPQSREESTSLRPQRLRLGVYPQELQQPLLQPQASKTSAASPSPTASENQRKRDQWIKNRWADRKWYE